MNANVRRRRRGFTLMEVLLVMVILVILGSFAVATYTGIQRQAKVDEAKAQIGLFKTPLQLYQLKIGEFPTTAQGLEALRSPPADLADQSKWVEFFNEPIKADPWDNNYMYASPGNHNPNSYDVWSMGPDGQDGTADDIGNWQ